MHTEGLGTLKWDGELCSHFPSVCSIPVSSCVTMRDASLQVFGSLALIVLSLRVTAALPVPSCLQQRHLFPGRKLEEASQPLWQFLIPEQ